MPLTENRATFASGADSNLLMDVYRRVTISAALAACLGLCAGLGTNSVANETGTIKQEDAEATIRWSPDRKTLARLESEQLFATPAGANSCLYFNAQPVYPSHCTPRPKATYRHIHTFLSPPEWSPDSRRVAVVEKIFDWEYLDPFGRYFDGESSDVHYYLVIAAIDRTVSGYALKTIGERPRLQWQGDLQLTLSDRTYDLGTHPPVPIP